MKEPITGPKLEIIWPAIDPTSTKNSEISPVVIRDILARYEIDPDRPIIAQISRFDPWKDPLGVLDVYKTLKEEYPALQLLMVAAMANDDPEAWSFYERIVRKAGEDYDIHVLTNLNGVGNLEVNAFQSAADVLLQKSIREGFGLVISEALWKSKALVGSEAGGIPAPAGLRPRRSRRGHHAGVRGRHPRVAGRQGSARGDGKARQGARPRALPDDPPAQGPPPVDELARRGNIAAMTAENNAVLGIDVGGTKILALAARPDGTTLASAVAETPSRDKAERVISAMAETARAAMTQAGLGTNDIGSRRAWPPRAP